MKIPQFSAPESPPSFVLQAAVYAVSQESYIKNLNAQISCVLPRRPEPALLLQDGSMGRTKSTPQVLEFAGRGAGLQTLDRCAKKTCLLQDLSEGNYAAFS